MSLWVEIRRLFDQLRTHGIYLTLLAGVDKFGRKLLGRPIWRFSWITPDILLGGQPARRLRADLSSFGVMGVVNLREEYDYAEEIVAATMPFKYLYLPTRDNTAPTLEHLEQGVQFMRDVVGQGGKLYIHCWEGLGRGPTMVAAYLVSLGHTPDEAWQIIRKVRPFVRPVPSQQARIREYAQMLADEAKAGEPVVT
ncbi:MAG: dual specificity protein phosphatase family protein [Anaerolineae bacterium]|jgi:protein-tyrosine phosphatase|nr:dual specificity protein phosphatase family protein [Anaerolineae bacterium]